jgi:hypothetical protein
MTVYNFAPFLTGLQVSSLLLWQIMTDESLLTHWTPPELQLLSDKHPSDLRMNSLL